MQNMLGKVDATGKLDCTVVDDLTPVPAGAVFVGGLAHTAAGSLYVATTPAGGTAPQGITYIGGLKTRVDGALIVNSTGSPTKAVNGLPTLNDELCIAAAVSATSYCNGLGINAGAVCTNL